MYVQTQADAHFFFRTQNDANGHKFILIFNLCHSRHLCFIPETLTV